MCAHSTHKMTGPRISRDDARGAVNGINFVSRRQRRAARQKGCDVRESLTRLSALKRRIGHQRLNETISSRYVYPNIRLEQR